MLSNDFVILSTQTKRKVAQINKKKTQFLCKLQAKENFLLFCSFTSLNYCKYTLLYRFVLFIFKLKFISQHTRERGTYHHETRYPCFVFRCIVVSYLIYTIVPINYSPHVGFRRYKRKLELSTIGLSCLSNSKYKCRT